MAIVATDKGGGDFKKLPQGTHIAVCNMVVDLGIQDGFYGPKHQVYLRFETPHERVQYEKDGKEIDAPMSIGCTYTLSLSEKANLRKDLENWRGRPFTKEELAGFDIAKIVGQPCQVTVMHNEKNGKTYANITGITALPKGMDKPKPETDLIVYDPDEHQDSFDTLPEWLQEKIKAQVVDGEDPMPAEAQRNGDDLDDSDIPF